MNLIEHAKAAINFGDFKLFENLSTTGVGLNELIANIIQVILYVAGVMAIIYLIYSGILYLTAAGNPDSAKKGQQGIINAIIGIIIIVLVWVIARSVAGFAETIGTN
mgnify:CR=1 FL=1